MKSNCGRGGGDRDDFYFDVFPPEFQWGFATAAYQIEGAWNLGDKGTNIWDDFTHRQVSPIIDKSTGNVACDSYHRYKEDIQALKETGAHFYRFSLNWARILPNGTISSVSQSGIDYYDRLINELVENGIEPMITLYHWDLPSALQEIGGWLNPEMANHFAEYARLAFKHFGDRVKNWITFNEPHVFAKYGYEIGIHAPGVRDPPEKPYQVMHTVLKAHGLTYRIYDADFRASQGGKVGISLNLQWNEPADWNNAEDVAAMHRALRFKIGWIAEPLFRGDYPSIMRQLIGEKSKAEGRSTSRLPVFDAEWSKIIKGTIDFLGLNHYTTIYIKNKPGGGPPGHDGDMNTQSFSDPNWIHSAATWLDCVPWGFRRVLNWIAMEYGNQTPIFITENGYADHPSVGTDDAGRVNYYKLYINELLKAVKIDGVNVQKYAAWSLIDNFEWGDGYTVRFGCHRIDFEGDDLTRVPKDSAKFLTQIIKDNGYPRNDQ